MRPGLSHIQCLLPGRRGRTYLFNFSVRQDMKILSQFNAFCRQNCDADTFSKCLWMIHHVMVYRKEQIAISGTWEQICLFVKSTGSEV
jgi:hypothetical protein